MKMKSKDYQTNIKPNKFYNIDFSEKVDLASITLLSTIDTTVHIL